MSIKKRRLSEVLVSEVLFFCPELEIKYTSTVLWWLNPDTEVYFSPPHYTGSVDVATCNCVLAATLKF